MRIGEKIGKLVKVDQILRGKYARLCVEVDITKLLLPRFKLRRIIRCIEYEVIYLVCFQCGVFGHRKEGCTVFQNPKEDDDKEKEVDRPKNQTRKVVHTKKGKKEMEVNPEVVDSYRPWMLVGRRFQRVNKRLDGSMVQSRGIGRRLGRSRDVSVEVYRSRIGRYTK